MLTESHLGDEPSMALHLVRESHVTRVHAAESEPMRSLAGFGVSGGSSLMDYICPQKVRYYFS